MTGKDLRKLNRYQLLELLILQTERADKLQQKLDEVERQLNDQELQLTALGSIAEASLQLSGVFQTAQDAADQYLAAAKKQADLIVETAKRNAAALIAEARACASDANIEEQK